MEYLPPGAATGGEDVRLGRGLAAIHARPRDGLRLPGHHVLRRDAAGQPREPDVGRVLRRAAILRPLARRLEQEERIGPGERRVLSTPGRPPAGSLLAHDAGPALIHGDLWSGNVLATTRGPALVDPACAACDREMEFGITTLFGGFCERFFAGYHEALPLPAGWRDRNPLYQLYHLLNHHLIFGGHYGREALSLARRYA